MDFGRFVYNMFMYVFGGGFFKDAAKTLSMNPTDGESFLSSAWYLVEFIYEKVCLPAGLGIMLIWFLVAFMQKAANEQVSFEGIFMLCAKLVIAFCLMTGGLQLFCDIWGFGIALTNEVTDAIIEKQEAEIPITPSAPAPGPVIPDTPSPPEEDTGIDISSGVSHSTLTMLWKDLTGCASLNELPGFWDSFVPFGVLLIPWLIAAVMRGCASFIAYSRLFEMLIRVAFAPIALADFFHEGLQGAGWRYLKAFFAICIQGAVIVVVAAFWSAVTQGAQFGGTFINVVVSWFVLSFAGLAVMFKSLSICKDIMGVH